MIHVEEHPSPSRVLPSSHSSDGWLREPSPQRGPPMGHAALLTVQPWRLGPGPETIAQERPTHSRWVLTQAAEFGQSGFPGPETGPQVALFCPLHSSWTQEGELGSQQSEGASHSLRPGPETWVHWLIPVQALCVSILQLFEQPSPLCVLPSSHCSGGVSTSPLPQTGSVQIPSSQSSVGQSLSVVHSISQVDEHPSSFCVL